MANDALMEALAAKHRAFTAADKNPCPANINDFLKATKAVEDAELKVSQVRMMQKHYGKPAKLGDQYPVAQFERTEDVLQS